MEKLKQGWGLRSYDEVIRKMIRDQTGRPVSLFGAARGAKPFVREPEDEHEILRN